ncbi:protein of unknown function [Taphrina deformans PYCC 5710]|uniref:Trafficking protein particle complex subunit 6B n=1 Tax=Taphrina deformans (strain PYCC 5710 / ATCC 11124 / CBS 356.35 / IMI 108563 / JCM 9778 / NBRC 8474) TaxID=1097556 RepID=R4XFR7_TAPDE|nr:protein of unknown function [Taphrina deformans PYCC 5710]|eukprot:CCG84593.1 protein of unknown function [Taphrina deformans PYCC 5710]
MSSISALADPHIATAQPIQHHVNASLQELLMIEMTSLAHRLTERTVLARSQSKQIVSSSLDEDDLSERELLESKLESIGYRVGHGLVERLSKDRPMLLDHLDIIKFVCKDLWTVLYHKQIDNLKTNHKGVYVLTDNQFRWFNKMSYHPILKPSQEALNKGKGVAGVGREYSAYLWFPCGVVRGALANLGMDSVVIAECPSGPPGVTFQIKTIMKET